MSERRTGFLLGAGASKDAGLPLTNELAVRLIEDANERALDQHGDELAKEPWSIALNFAYGAMVGHQADGGGNPLAAVNVERLISALRLLQHPLGHEAAPFVLSWKTLVHSLGRRRISAPHGKLRSIFQYARRVGASELPFDDVETAIAEIAEMVVQTHADGGPVFREAEEHVLRGLNRVLSGLQGVDYLSPILELAGRQRGGVDVISLNYDLAVETAVRQTESIAVETGIGKWVPGLTVPFEMTDSQVNLIKIHGSLNWRRRRSNSLAGGVQIFELKADGTPEGDGSGSYSQGDLPWIVVGDREKLATDGPTLDLLVAAREALNRTDNLVVVGYGFADDHVNNLARDWMARRDTNTITIVSPDIEPGGYDASDFRRALCQLYEATLGNRMVSRVAVVAKGAADGLPLAIKYQYPAPQDPMDYLAVKVDESGEDSILLRVTCNGPALLRLLISVSSTMADGGSHSRREKLPIYESPEALLAAGKGVTGKSLGVELRGLRQSEERELHLPKGPYGEIVVSIHLERVDSIGFVVEDTCRWTDSIQMPVSRRIIPTSRAYGASPSW